MMSAFTKIATVEAKLALRSPAWALAAVLLPTVVLVVCGFIPGMSEPSPATHGYRFLDLYAPSMIVITVCMLGLQTLPTAVATYREQGVLRRYATTPIHPAYLLLSQLLVHVVVAVLGVVLLLAVGHAAFDVPLPRHPLWFALALLLGLTSVFGLGLIAAARARTGKAASGLAMVAFFPALFLGGVYLPRPLLPQVVQRIGEYVPPGVQPLQDAWVGNGPQPLQLLVLAAFAIGGVAVAVRVFRWE